MMKLKRKINLTKGLQNDQKNKNQIKKITYYKLKLNNQIENKSKLKKKQEKNKKIKK